MALEGKLLMALEGSLIDLVQQRIPNYRSSTSRVMVRLVDGGIRTYSVEAYTGAVDDTTSSILIEPGGINLLTHNMDLTQDVWIDGALINIDPQSGLAPNGSDRSDAITFAGGDLSPAQASLQTLKRSISLPAETHFQLRAFLMLADNSKFALSDTNVLRVVGDVVNPVSAYLADLNAYPGRFRELLLSFKTGGKQPPPIEDGTSSPFNVTTIHGSREITLEHTEGLPDAIEANEFAGGQLTFDSPPGTPVSYVIESHQASVGDSIRFTLISTANIIADGVTTSSMVSLDGAPEQNVDIELYATSIAKIYWGGMFLEEGEFPTSPIYQKEEIFVRDAVELKYLESPIAGLSSFGVFLDIERWHGDGNILDAGNFRIEIVNGDLVVTAGSTTLTAGNLAHENIAVYIDISEESQAMSLYIQQTLIDRVGISEFSGDLDASLDLSSDGVRLFRRPIFTRSLLDGQAQIGQTAGQEVEELFTDLEVIPFKWLSASAPKFELPLVTVPGTSNPTAQTRITGISTNQLSVLDSTNFVNGAEIEAWRNGPPGRPNSYRVKYLSIDGAGGVPNSTTINVSDAGDLRLNDFLVYGNRVPGRASIRFPFTPMDVQEILAVGGTEEDPTLTVANATGFSVKRAIIQDQRGRDVAEVLIESVDTTNDVLHIDRSVAAISSGHLISQVKLDKELHIDPAVYEAYLLDQVDNVTLEKYQNGVVAVNYNSEAVEIRVQIQVYL